jgi:hypothetical protein
MFGNIKSLKLHTKSTVAAAGLLALVTLPSAVQAMTGPFAALSGSWSGGGTITMSNGAKERIRCRAQYNVGGAGANVDLTLRCASDSYTFELQSNASYSNGAVTGTWSEKNLGVGGSIEGSGNGSSIKVRVSGPISASLALNTVANQQSISIQAPGTELQNVAISLSRKSEVASK